MTEHDDKLYELRKLIDKKTWPREYLIMNGELYWFMPSGDPFEERMCRTLYAAGRFQ